jgi:hypothetical protein
MRTLRTVILLLLFCGTAGYSQVEWAVLRIGVVDTTDRTHWIVPVYVDIFDANNNLLAPLAPQ